MQENFSTAFALVKQQFIQVINTMDSIKLFGNFSILEFFIALLVLGAILPIVIITVANWASDSYGATVRADRREEAKQARQAYYNKRSGKGG